MAESCDSEMNVTSFAGTPAMESARLGTKFLPVSVTFSSVSKGAAAGEMLSMRSAGSQDRVAALQISSGLLHSAALATQLSGLS
jgi:hypothetical protein